MTLYFAGRKVHLAIVGLIFVVSGVLTFFDPQTMGDALGIAPLNASGEMEIRASYAGLVVGSGLVMFLGLYSRVWTIATLADAARPMSCGRARWMSTNHTVGIMEHRDYRTHVGVYSK